MPSFKRAVCAALLFVLAVFAIGCQAVDQTRVNPDRHDQMPWNERAGWEDQGLGVPF